jgi:hypothetical protein
MERASAEVAIRVLESDWQEPLRCTNIEQAMSRAGLPFRDADRRRIAQAILEDRRLADLLRWHPSAYFLTNNERLTARAVLQTLQGSTGEVDLPRRVSEVLSLPEEEVEAALNALAWSGFLEREGRGVRLSPHAPRFLEGVGFYFHEVLAGVERFNVNCFHDFVLLTSLAYRARRLRKRTRRGPDAPGMTPKMLAFLQSFRPEDLVRRTYDQGTVHLHDACAQCMRRIHLTVTDGRLVATDPAGAWHVRGGGCGVNNLFCCAGCAQGWVQTNPRFADSERGPVEALW